MAELLLSDSGPRHRGFGLVLDSLCKLFAVASGLALIAMAVMSLWSIVGRTFFDSALLGDFELVQFLCALAVAMGLPYAQWVNGNVIVDFFTNNAPAKVNAVLDAIARLIMAFFSGLIAWRLYVGMFELRESGDASMMIEIPTWWAYLPMVLSFALLAVVSLYGILDNLKKIKS